MEQAIQSRSAVKSESVRRLHEGGEHRVHFLDALPSAGETEAGRQLVAVSGPPADSGDGFRSPAPPLPAAGPAPVWDYRQLLCQVFDQSSEAIVITDSANRIIATNRAFSRLTGYTPEEVMGRTTVMLRSGAEPRGFYLSIRQALLTTGEWQGELWGRRRDGSAYPKWACISVVKDDRDRIVNYLARFSDITEQKLARETIEQLSHHDPLTGLPNRNSLIARLGQALEMAKRSGQHLAVMFIDLDRFKTINDSLGHRVGDRLLCEVAQRLMESVRSADIVARLGGDEFVVVLPFINSGIETAHIAKKILRRVGAPCLLDGHSLHTTPSIGISVYPHDGQSVDALMKHADAAMYHAKEQGRNNYQFFRREMHNAARERLKLEIDLRRALERGEFFLCYQPQVELSSGRVAGVEALVRWRHPERGLVMPDSFIALAEETGLIIPLGEFVLESACRQLKAWQDEGISPFRMAVNLSARQFKQRDLGDTVAAVIARTGIAPGSLELEITEGAAMEQPEEAIRIFNRLNAMGVELSIDDFGTGYSSLSYLKLFPVKRLKIDRSFVKDIETDGNDAAIAAATIALAHTLGKEVVAEGVETAQQLDFLKKHGCDLVQGYLYSRPVPAGELADFVKSGLPGISSKNGSNGSPAASDPSGERGAFELKTF